MAKYIKGTHDGDYIKIVYGGIEYRIDFDEGKPISSVTPESSDSQVLDDERAQAIFDAMLSTFEAAPDQTDQDNREIFVVLPREDG